MPRATSCLLVLVLAAGAGPLLALSPGPDIMVPAASRGPGLNGSLWVTDLYVFNPGGQAASLTLYWLVRGQPNLSPISQTFSLGAGETLVLADVIQQTFGMGSANGAFRVTADSDVVVNTRIYNLKGTVTFGQGFAGVPISAATTAGAGTDVVGLSQNAGFRTNLVVVDASGAGSTVTLTLRDTTGVALAAGTYTLGAFEPRLFPVTDLDGTTAFDDATLHAEVTSGAVIVAASKVDNDPATGDPTTLEAWSPPGLSASVDGTYQLAVYDSLDYATGGNMVVSGGLVTSFVSTYSNWDKLDATGASACTVTFKLGGSFVDPLTLDLLAGGVSWTDTYDGGGSMTWLVQLTIADGMTVTGTLSAEGAGFPASDSGCNGTFPVQVLRGGKS